MAMNPAYQCTHVDLAAWVTVTRTIDRRSLSEVNELGARATFRVRKTAMTRGSHRIRFGGIGGAGTATLVIQEQTADTIRDRIGVEPTAWRSTPCSPSS